MGLSGFWGRVFRIGSAADFQPGCVEVSPWTPRIILPSPPPREADGLKGFRGEIHLYPGNSKKFAEIFSCFLTSPRGVWDVMYVPRDWYLWRRQSRRAYLLIWFYRKVRKLGHCRIFIFERARRRVLFVFQRAPGPSQLDSSSGTMK